MPWSTSTPRSASSGGRGTASSVSAGHSDSRRIAGIIGARAAARHHLRAPRWRRGPPGARAPAPRRARRRPAGRARHGDPLAGEAAPISVASRARRAASAAAARSASAARRASWTASREGWAAAGTAISSRRSRTWNRLGGRSGPSPDLSPPPVSAGVAGQRRGPWTPIPGVGRGRVSGNNGRDGHGGESVRRSHLRCQARSIGVQRPFESFENAPGAHFEPPARTPTATHSRIPTWVAGWVPGFQTVS